MKFFQMVRIAVCGAGLLSAASAQQHEVGLTLAGILSQQRSEIRGPLPGNPFLGEWPARYPFRKLQRHS